MGNKPPHASDLHGRHYAGRRQAAVRSEAPVPARALTEGQEVLRHAGVVVADEVRNVLEDRVALVRVDLGDEAEVQDAELAVWRAEQVTSQSTQIGIV